MNLRRFGLQMLIVHWRWPAACRFGGNIYSNIWLIFILILHSLAPNQVISNFNGLTSFGLSTSSPPTVSVDKSSPKYYSFCHHTFNILLSLSIVARTAASVFFGWLVIVHVLLHISQPVEHTSCRLSALSTWPGCSWRSCLWFVSQLLWYLNDTSVSNESLL